jgi:inorganic pyrophosphatase
MTRQANLAQVLEVFKKVCDFMEKSLENVYVNFISWENEHLEYSSNEKIIYFNMKGERVIVAVEQIMGHAMVYIHEYGHGEC